MDRSPNKVMVMLLTGIRLVQGGWGSPVQVQQILSTLQWYDFIFRAKVSENQHIYGFADRRHDKRGKTCPHVSLESLYSAHCWLSSGRLICAGPLLPLICCSDASSSLGFGGSILKTCEDVVQKLVRLALKDDAFTVLDKGVRAGDYHKRIGSLLSIGVSRDAFTHVCSVRQTRLMLRWILGSSMRHASRVVILLDSAVLLGGTVPREDHHQGSTQFCVGQLLSSCSVTFRCFGIWCHRRRISATFRQEDAGAGRYRRRRHWLTTKGSVPVSSINVTNTSSFHSSSLRAWTRTGMIYLGAVLCPLFVFLD